MLTLIRTALPADEAALRAALARYQDAVAAHAKTVGQPAPWPEHDILRDIVRAGGDFTVVEEIAPARSAREEAVALIEARREAALDRSVAWNGRNWHLDETFTAHLTGLIAAHLAGIVPDAATHPIRSFDNETVQLGLLELKQLAAVVLFRVQEIWGQSFTEKDALR